MSVLYNIFNNVSGKVKVFLSFALMFLLSSCGECETIKGYLNGGTGENCFFCPLFDVLTISGANAADKAWSIIAADAQPVVIVVIAIYIAFNTFKMVASLGQQSFADYLSDNKEGALFLGFKAAVIVLLLHPDNFMVRYVIAPLLEAAANVGIGLAGGVEINPPVIDKQNPWSGLFALINEVARGFNDVAYEIVAIGKALICNSTDAWIILKWKLAMLLYGNIVLLFGWMVCIGVCYFLVDLIINLICASVLLPLGIALAISEKTMPHSKNIWNLFVNSFCSCLCLGAVLSLAIAMIELNMGGGDVLEKINSASLMGRSDNALERLAANNQISQINEYMQKDGRLIILIVSLTLLVKVIDSVKDLAKKLASTSGLTSAGSKTLTPITKKAGKEGFRLAKDASKNVGHVIARITHLDELATFGKDKFQRARGFLTGSGPQGYRAFWRR